MVNYKFLKYFIPSVMATAIVVPPTAIAIAQYEPKPKPDPVIQVYDVRTTNGAVIDADKKRVQEKVEYSTFIRSTIDKQIIGVTNILVDGHDNPLVEGTDYSFDTSTNYLVIHAGIIDGDVTINVAFDKIDVKVISPAEIVCETPMLNYQQKGVLIFRAQTEHGDDLSTVLLYVGDEPVEKGWKWAVESTSTEALIYVSITDGSIVTDTISVFIPLGNAIKPQIECSMGGISLEEQYAYHGYNYYTDIYSPFPLSEEIYVYVDGMRIRQGFDFYCYNNWDGSCYYNRFYLYSSSIGNNIVIQLYPASEKVSTVKLASDTISNPDQYFDLSRGAFQSYEYNDTLKIKEGSNPDFNYEDLEVYMTNKAGEVYEGIHMDWWNVYPDSHGLNTIMGLPIYQIPSQFVDEELTIHVDKLERHKIKLSSGCEDFVTLSKDYMYAERTTEITLNCPITFTGKITVTDGTRTLESGTDYYFDWTRGSETATIYFAPDINISGDITLDIGVPSEYENIIYGGELIDVLTPQTTKAVKNWSTLRVRLDVTDFDFYFAWEPTANATVDGQDVRAYIGDWSSKYVVVTIYNDSGLTGPINININKPAGVPWRMKTPGCWFMNSDGTLSKEMRYYYNRSSQTHFKVFFEVPPDRSKMNWAKVSCGSKWWSTDTESWFGWSSYSDQVYEFSIYFASTGPCYWDYGDFEFILYDTTPMNVTVGDGRYTDQFTWAANTPINQHFDRRIYFKKDSVLTSEDIVFNDITVTINGKKYSSSHFNIQTGNDYATGLNYLEIYAKDDIYIDGPVQIDLPVLDAVELVSDNEDVTFTAWRAYKNVYADFVTFVTTKNAVLSKEIELEVNGQPLSKDQYVYVPEEFNDNRSAYLMIDKDVIAQEDIHTIHVKTQTTPTVNVSLTNYNKIYSLSTSSIKKGVTGSFDIVVPGTEFDLRRQNMADIIQKVHLWQDGKEITSGWTYELLHETIDWNYWYYIHVTIDDASLTNKDISVSLDVNEGNL